MAKAMLQLLLMVVLAVPFMLFWMIADDPHNLYRLLNDGARRHERRKEEADRVQAEIDRKCAIADQAIAARARGETFVPPPDYDR